MPWKFFNLFSLRALLSDVKRHSKNDLFIVQEFLSISTY